jgi:hypothetical protein
LLTALAWVYLGICFVCAGMIAYDIFVNHRRQPIGVTDAVFPITTALLWPVCARARLRWGRAGVLSPSAPSNTIGAAMPGMEDGERPRQHATAQRLYFARRNGHFEARCWTPPNRP